MTMTMPPVYKCSVGSTDYLLVLNSSTGYYAFNRTSPEYSTYIPKDLIDQLVKERVRETILSKLTKLFDH